MELETINKLYLELSQVATAQTDKEKLYLSALYKIRNHLVHNDTSYAAKEMLDIANETIKRATYR